MGLELFELSLTLALVAEDRSLRVPHGSDCERGETMKQLFRNILVEESGQDLIEYALVAALVGLGAVVSMGSLKNSISNAFNGVGNALTAAVA
jgi:pilus assembly protein Flp/PilA